MVRKLLATGLLAICATDALAVTSTVSGHFRATDWVEILGDPSPPIGSLVLHYSVTFDPTLTYSSDAAALTVIQTNIPYALRFSYNPVSSLFVLATDGSPNGCTLSAGSFCAYGFSVYGGAPTFVAQAPADGGAWQAALIADETQVGPIGVPEPASWAMLIAGFGLVGSVLRRRGAALA